MKTSGELGFLWILAQAIKKKGKKKKKVVCE